MNVVNYLNHWDPAWLFLDQAWASQLLSRSTTREWLQPLGFRTQAIPGDHVYQMPALPTPVEVDAQIKALSAETWNSWANVRRMAVSQERRIQDRYRLHLHSSESRASLLKDVANSRSLGKEYGGLSLQHRYDIIYSLLRLEKNGGMGRGEISQWAVI